MCLITFTTKGCFFLLLQQENMSWLGRKRGKPNRGGGRGRGGSGRRGGSSGHSNKPQLGGNRKCSTKIWDDGDDFCLFEEPRLESRYFC